MVDVNAEKVSSVMPLGFVLGPCHGDGNVTQGSEGRPLMFILPPRHSR